MNPILDHPEPPKPTGKWLSVKLLGYGLGIMVAVVLLNKGFHWLMAMYHLQDYPWGVVLKILLFLASLAFVVINTMGLVAAITYLKGGYDSNERTAGWIGLGLNLLPGVLFFIWLLV